MGGRKASPSPAQLEHPALGSTAAKWTLWDVLRTDSFLVFVPLGLTASLWRWNPLAILVLNFVAIIPLSAIGSTASDKVAGYWGSLVGSLVNATFANSVELIWGILSIRHGESHLASAAMLGSILSNILLVNGACLIAAAGWKATRHFNATMADSLSSLMIIAAMALMLPTVLYATNSHAADIDAKILTFSRATAVVLLLIYVVYLYFQLWTHKDLFTAEQGGEESEVESDAENDSESDMESDTESQAITNPKETSPTPEHVEGTSKDGVGAEKPDKEPQLQKSPDSELYMTMAVLAVSSVFIMNCTRCVLDNIDQAAEFAGVTKTFIATILMPIVSNASEGSTALMASRKSRVDFAIGVVVGSTLQIALFVLPLLVILGWFMREPMTLYFDGSQISILFLAVLTIQHLHQDGTYTYLHGVMLISLYGVFTMAIMVLPEI